MKRYFYAALVCLASMAFFCACNNDEPEKAKVNFDKMVGTWKLNSYKVLVTNLDESKELENISRNKGTMTVTKKTEDGDTNYYYTENFVNENGEEYSGRFIISNGTIEMAAQDGFRRSDGATTYDFTVSKLTNTQMEWTYDVVQDYSSTSTGEKYKRKTVATAHFSK